MSDNGLALARRSLTIIAALGLAGSAFSGALTFRELVGTGAGCPVASATMFGVPVCVYGFAMFVAITAIAFWGLLSAPRRVHRHAS